MENKPPILLCAFMHWHEDQKQLERVARLACDLLEEASPQAECMFVGRYDSPAPTPAIQHKVREKFANTHVWRCDRKALGFPGGCNEMAYGLLNHVLISRHMNHGFKNIDAILILEADCVITRKNWLWELEAEWTKTRAEGKQVCGTLQKQFTINNDYVIAEHINAVAMYDAEIVRTIPALRGGPNYTGWDHYHGPAIVPHARDSKLFKLDYRRPSITAEELFASEALIYHGVKDESALKAVREKYSL